MAIDKDNEKIVKISFDNAKFEKDVKTSMKSLDNLDNKLKKVDDKKYNFDGLSKNIHKLSDVTLRNMSRNVEMLSKRFSTMGIAGQEVIRHLTNDVLKLGSSITQVISNNVIGGGLRRSFNLEQADFQLQGLLKNSKKVNAIMENVSESVDGTAYSLDSAAKAASQFAATGMRAGDEMLGALKGVAGVAAMTGADYDNISQIFIKVAGNGRLMGDELLQLSSNGLNAAASIAKFMSKYDKSTTYTEQNVREMVSKGQISFKLFASAMDDAFGEHAKKANDTFNGAMSNVKAALGRIGADFFQPIIKNKGPFIDLLNTVRTKIDDIHKITKPVAIFLSDVVNKSIKYTTKLIKQVNVFGSSFGVFSKIIDNKKIGPKVINALTKSFMSLLRTVTTVARLFKEAWRVIFPKDNLGFVVKIIIGFVKFSNALKINAERASTLKTIFEGVAATFGIIKNVIKIVITALFNLNRGSDGLLSRLGSLLIIISNILVKVNSFLTDNEKLYSSISNISNIVKKFVGILHKITFTGLSKVDTLLGSITKKATAAKSAVQKVSQVTNAQNQNGEKTTAKKEEKKQDTKKEVEATNKQTQQSQQQAVKTESIWTRIGNTIKSALQKIGQSSPAVLKKIGNVFLLAGKRIIKFIGEVLDNLAYQLTHATLSEIIDSITGIFQGKAMLAMSKFLTSLDGFTSKLAKSLSGIKSISDSFCGVLNSLRKTLETYQKTIKADVIKKIAISVGILAISLLALSFIPTNKIAVALGGLASICTALVASVVILNKALNGKDGDENKNVTSLLKLSAFVLAFGIMVSSIAVSLRILASANISNLITAMAGMEVLILTISIVYRRISKIKVNEGSVKSVQQFIKMLIPLAFSVSIMAAAMSLLARYDYKNILAVTGSMILLITSMATMSMMLSKNKVDGIKNVKSYIAFSAAMVILAYSLAQLSKINWKELGTSIISLEIMMWSIVGIMKVMGDGSISKAWSAASFTACAAAILLVSFALVPITKIQTDQLIKAILAIDAILISLLLIMKRFMSASEINVAKGVMSLIFMANMLITITKSINTIAKNDWISLTAACAGLSAVVLSLMALVVAVNKGGIQDIRGIASYATLTASISTLGNALKNISGVPWQQLLVGLGAMEIIVWTMFGMVVAINKINVTSGIANAAGYIIFANTVMGIAKVVKEFAAMDQNTILLATSSMMILVGSLTLMYAKLIEEAGRMNVGDVLRLATVVGAYVILSSSVAVICNGLSKLKGMNVKTLIGTTISIVALLGSMTAILGILKEMDQGYFNAVSIGKLASAFTTMSMSILIIAYAMSQLKDMGITELISIAGTLVVLLGAMVGALALLNIITKTASTFDIAVLVGAMNGMAIAFNLMALAVKQLADLDLNSMLVAIGVFTGLTAVLVLLGGLMAICPAIAAGLASVSLSFVAFGFAMLEVGAGFNMFANGVKLFGEGLQYWYATIRPIMGPLASLFVDTVKAIGRAIAEFLGYLGDFIKNALASVHRNLPEIIKIGASIVMGFLQGLVEKIPDIVAYGALMVTGFFQGLISHMDEMVTAAVTLVFVFIESLAKALADDKNMARVRNIIDGFTKYVCNLIDTGFKAAEEIGQHLIEGLIKGIVKKGPNLLTAIGNVAIDLKNEFCDFFGIKSPSKKFMTYGEYLMQGLSKGIKKEKSQNKAAEKAGKEVVKSYQKGTKSQMSIAKQDEITEMHKVDQSVNDEYEKIMAARAKRRKELDEEYAKKRKASISEIYAQETEAQYEGINRANEAEERKLTKKYKGLEGKAFTEESNPVTSKINSGMNYLKEIFGVGDTKSLDKLLKGNDANDMAKPIKNSTKTNKKYDIKSLLNGAQGKKATTSKSSYKSNIDEKVITTPTKRQLISIGSAYNSYIAFGINKNVSSIKKSTSNALKSGATIVKEVQKDLLKGGSVFSEFLDKSTQDNSKKRVKELKKERSELQAQLKQANKKDNQNRKEDVKSLKKQLDANSKNLKNAQRGNAITLKQSAEAFIAYRDAVKKSLEDVTKSFEALDLGETMATKDIMSNLDSQAKGINKWINALKVARDKGVNKDLISKWTKEGVSSYKEVGAVVGMTSKQVMSLNSKWERNQRVVKNASDIATMNLVKVGKTTKNTAKGMADMVNFNGKTYALAYKDSQKVIEQLHKINTWTIDKDIKSVRNSMAYGQASFNMLLKKYGKDKEKLGIKSAKKFLNALKVAAEKEGKILYEAAHPDEAKAYEKSIKQAKNYYERMLKKHGEFNEKTKAAKEAYLAQEREYNEKVAELYEETYSKIADNIKSYLSFSNISGANPISDFFTKVSDNSYDEYQKKKDEMEKLKSEMDKAYKEYEDASKNTNTVAQRLKASELSQVYEKAKEKYESAKDEYEGMEEISAKKFAENLKGKNDAYEEFGNQLDLLRNLGYSEDVIKYVEEQGYEAGRSYASALIAGSADKKAVNDEMKRTKKYAADKMIKESRQRMQNIKKLSENYQKLIEQGFQPELLAEYAQQGIDEANEAFSTMLEMDSDQKHQYQSNFQQSLEIPSTVITAIQESWTNKLNPSLGKAVDNIKVKSDDVKEAAGTIGSALKEALSKDNKLANDLAPVVGDQIAMAAQHGLANALTSNGNSKDSAANIAYNIESGIIEPIADVLNKKGKNMAAEHGTGKAFEGVGKAIIAGMVNGIKGKKKGKNGKDEENPVVKALVGLINTAIKKTKAAAKVKSPSRVFKEIGNNLTEGLTIGIKDKAKLATDAMSNTIRSIMNTADSAEFTASPTISPVLDMDNMSTVSDLGDMAYSISSDLDKMSTLYANIEEARRYRLKVTNSLDEITKKMDNLDSSQIVTNNINMSVDGSKGAIATADEISRTLQTQVERRVAVWA